MRFSHIAIVILSFFLYQCANQTSPTGGPKDLDPPLLINSTPEDQSLNFGAKEIILTFDEYVKLNNARQQVIITPRIDQEVIYSYRKNKVIIEFSESLSPNTTYNLNFREAVQDITESNPANINLAFSTGNYIDTLSISGNIYHLLKDQPAANTLVALQIPMDTAIYFMHPALYFTRTLKDGLFSFSNIKDGQYHLYAFEDNNNDLTLQPAKEKHGFISQIIELDSNVAQVKIPLVHINTDTLKVISDRQSGLYHEANFNKYITDYEIVNNNQQLPYILTEDHTTLRIFNINKLQDSTILTIRARDSIEYNISRDIKISYNETQRKPLPLNQKLKKPLVTVANPVINSTISFDKPISTINFDSLYVFIDSLNILPITQDHIQADSARSVFDITLIPDPKIFQPKEDAPTSRITPYLYFGKGAFISIESDSSKKEKIDFKVYPESQLGIFFVEIDVPYEHFIVELMDGKQFVMERRFNERNIRFANLLPGTYNLRVLEDKDNNQVWDAGNIFLNEKPSEVLYYINSEGTKDIIIRANWEVGPYKVSK